MPYIKSEQKEELCYRSPNSSGELNYLLTHVCLDYLDAHSLSYQTINDIVGALESCKLEFYRKVAVGYENQKEFENGKVYE